MELQTALLPINKHDLPDTRYEPNIKKILEMIGSKHVEVLDNLYKQTTEASKKASNSGFILAKAILDHIDWLDAHEKFDENDRFIGWKAKSMRKRLTESLTRVGFKKNHAHKIVVAVQWERSLRNRSHWIDSLDLSHKYELAMMSEEGFNVVVQEVSNPEHGLVCGHPCKEWNPISVRRLEEIKRMYPKKEHEPIRIKPIDVEVLRDDPTSITEEVLERSKQEMNQYELIDDLVETVQLIDTAEIYKDEAVIAKLHKVSTKLWGVAHLAKEPLGIRKPVQI
tara:strand:+ start:3552 stop:4394 length:843 start_codon:yes stop_codon:yes gene_type:complete